MSLELSIRLCASSSALFVDFVPLAPLALPLPPRRCGVYAQAAGRAPGRSGREAQGPGPGLHGSLARQKRYIDVRLDETLENRYLGEETDAAPCAVWVDRPVGSRQRHRRHRRHPPQTQKALLRSPTSRRKQDRGCWMVLASWLTWCSWREWRLESGESQRQSVERVEAGAPRLRGRRRMMKKKVSF